MKKILVNVLCILLCSEGYVFGMNVHEKGMPRAFQNKMRADSVNIQYNVLADDAIKMNSNGLTDFLGGKIYGDVSAIETQDKKSTEIAVSNTILNFNDLSNDVFDGVKFEDLSSNVKESAQPFIKHIEENDGPNKGDIYFSVYTDDYGEHKIYFPANAVQQSAEITAKYSLAKGENVSNSKITDWYMKMCGIIPFYANDGREYFVQSGWEENSGKAIALRMIEICPLFMYQTQEDEDNDKAIIAEAANNMREFFKYEFQHNSQVRCYKKFNNYLQAAKEDIRKARQCLYSFLKVDNQLKRLQEYFYNTITISKTTLNFLQLWSDNGFDNENSVAKFLIGLNWKEVSDFENDIIYATERSFCAGPGCKIIDIERTQEELSLIDSLLKLLDCLVNAQELGINSEEIKKDKSEITFKYIHRDNLMSFKEYVSGQHDKFESFDKVKDIFTEFYNAYAANESSNSKIEELLNKSKATNLEELVNCLRKMSNFDCIENKKLQASLKAAQSVIGRNNVLRFGVKTVIDSFRTFSSVPVGRVILYELLMEINRTNVNLNGCAERPEWDCPDRKYQRNIIITLNPGAVFFCEGNISGGPIINLIFNNCVLGYTPKVVLGISGNYIISNDLNAMDVNIAHETVHWLHSLRNYIRFRAEKLLIGSRSVHVDDSFLFSYYFKDPCDGKKDALDSFELEEIRTIYGSCKLDPNYEPCDDVSECLYIYSKDGQCIYYFHASNGDKDDAQLYINDKTLSVLINTMEEKVQAYGKCGE